MKLNLFILLTLFLAGQLSWAQNASPICHSDKELGPKWKIHLPGQFEAIASEVLNNYEQDLSHFVDDTDGYVRSKLVNRTFKLESKDDLRTPQREMYGDLIIIQTLEGELAEIRWYEDGTKHIVYNRQFTPCSIALYPIARNTLF